MTEEEMIENLAESAKKEHIRNEIQDLLNDKIKEAVNIHKKDLKYISNLEMEKFMEKDEFLESGAGKLLIKYFQIFH